MKNWIRKRLRKFLMDEPERDVSLRTAVSQHEDFSEVNNLNLNVYYATGGVVVKTYKHDRNTNRSHSGFYIIREDQDLAQELARLVTLEMLR